jgi:hypothetical protein
VGLSIKADTALVTPRINRKTKTDFVPSTKAIKENVRKLLLKSMYFLSRQESVQQFKVKLEIR